MTTAAAKKAGSVFEPSAKSGNRPYGRNVERITDQSEGGHGRAHHDPPRRYEQAYQRKDEHGREQAEQDPEVMRMQRRREIAIGRQEQARGICVVLEECH